MTFVRIIFVIGYFNFCVLLFQLFGINITILIILIIYT